jgi:oligosaccharide repeat unit polymerase
VYKEKSTTLLRLVISVAVSLFYAYLSTGRTNFLLLLLMVLMPLILLGIVRIKGLIIAFLLIGVTFVLVAAMTAKGVSLEASFSENTASLMENLTAYTAAPFVAMSKLVQVDRPADWGANTSRFFMSALYALGAIESPPSSLIRDYVFVPNPTNVYTVYDVYFRDFSYFGLFIPPLILAFHWWLYRQARVAAGRWVFYYAASVYPLVMQFFQDQYFSLLSIWIQLGFWFWVFVAPGKIVRAEFRPHHA